MNRTNPYTNFLRDGLHAPIGRERIIQQILEGLTDRQPRSFQIVGVRQYGRQFPAALSRTRRASRAKYAGS